MKFETNINLNENTRSEMIDLLNDQLSDLFDLYSQVKQAHWNVKGMQFYSLHELFDKLAEEILPLVDEMAERITTLGGLAKGTVHQASKGSCLADLPLETVECKAILERLIERFATVSANLRSAIDKADDAKDKDTADLFTEVSRLIDKQLWFLESHIQN